jgi:hypothetical protein
MGCRLNFLDLERHYSCPHELDTPDDQSALAEGEALLATHQGVPVRRAKRLESASSLASRG